MYFHSLREDECLCKFMSLCIIKKWNRHNVVTNTTFSIFYVVLPSACVLCVFALESLKANT